MSSSVSPSSETTTIVYPSEWLDAIQNNHVNVIERTTPSSNVAERICRAFHYKHTKPLLHVLEDISKPDPSSAYMYSREMQQTDRRVNLLCHCISLATIASCNIHGRFECLEDLQVASYLLALFNDSAMQKLAQENQTIGYDYNTVLSTCSDIHRKAEFLVQENHSQSWKEHHLHDPLVHRVMEFIHARVYGL